MAFRERWKRKMDYGIHRITKGRYGKDKEARSEAAGERAGTTKRREERSEPRGAGTVNYTYEEETQ